MIPELRGIRGSCPVRWPSSWPCPEASLPLYLLTLYVSISEAASSSAASLQISPVCAAHNSHAPNSLSEPKSFLEDRLGLYPKDKDSSPLSTGLVLST